MQHPIEEEKLSEINWKSGARKPSRKKGLLSDGRETFKCHPDQDIFILQPKLGNPIGPLHQRGEHLTSSVFHGGGLLNSILRIISKVCFKKQSSGFWDIWRHEAHSQISPLETSIS